MQNPPQEIIAAARLIEEWAAKHNLETMRVGRVCYIRSFVEIDDEWCDDYHCAGDCGLKGHGYQHSNQDTRTPK